MLMINRLHATIFRPENGWDPVSTTHSSRYADGEWGGEIDESLLDSLDAWLGGLSGKKVLDLGGGPGHYAVAFAKRGALVTWHDVSANYMKIARQKAIEHSVDIEFSLGYLDEALSKVGNQFDLVFNRICWYYSWDDKSFAQTLFLLVKPGGVAYVDSTHSGWRRESLALWPRFTTWLNDNFCLKIGHPYPPHNRIASLFSKMAVEKILIDYSAQTSDRITFKKASL